MVKIGILNIHSGYDENLWYVDTFTYGKIRENINEYYTEVNINSVEDLMLNVYNYLQPTEHTVLNITDLTYNYNTVIQSIYNICQDINDSKFNKLASQLTKNINVNGYMILIKRDISNDKLKYLDFTVNDLVELIKNTFVHNSLIVKPNNNTDNNYIINFPYINDVLESKIEEYTFKNIRYYEHKFLDYILTFYCDTTIIQDDNNFNNLASTIFGKKIYGDVYITLTTTREDFLHNLNLTEELLLQIYYIHATKSNEIDFKKYMVQPKQTSSDLNDNGFPAVTYYPNFFYVISKEYSLVKNKPIILNCNEFSETLNNIV
jgi:hypothetical protein